MDHSVLSWLDASASLYGDSVIFADQDRSITFDTFNKFTKAIGTCLAGKAAPVTPIAVMTGRHALTPACYLGVARAGCFYAPMDATMPMPRLNQILSVIKADLMLVDREHLEKAQALDYDGEILVMEDILDTPADEDLLAKAVSTLTDLSPLYVIFTSGSTGMPKGVITSHNSLMCYIDAVSEVLELDNTDILGNQSPLDYIAAIRDIYLPIRTGARTFIIPKNEFAMPEQLFATMNREGVTTICWSTAGVELPAKLGAFNAATLPHLKRVLFSGSVISSRYLRIWQQNLPSVTFINQYGPTEATASCTYYKITGEVMDDTVLPIGRPYKHYDVLLLNEDLTATPDGEIGEICVKGPCLALGYYGNEEKTQASFIQNPLNRNYREIIYKTGDLGRFAPDGQLEFIGRKDRQIKHMGHRIELDEIEGTARLIEGVDDCCALYLKEKQLLYLFYTGTATARDITIYFRAQLPAFMVPRRIRQLDEFPRLANGKKDMQSLKEDSFYSSSCIFWIIAHIASALLKFSGTRYSGPISISNASASSPTRATTSKESMTPPVIRDFSLEKSTSGRMSSSIFNNSSIFIPPHI